jgi:hypothetical protein
MIHAARRIVPLAGLRFAHREVGLRSTLFAAAATIGLFGLGLTTHALTWLVRTLRITQNEVAAQDLLRPTSCFALKASRSEVGRRPPRPGEQNAALQALCWSREFAVINRRPFGQLQELLVRPLNEFGEPIGGR